jgi:prefoldin subunit 5
MELSKEKKKLEQLVQQHNQTAEQIQMLQSSIGDLKLQISRQQGVCDALDRSLDKGKKNAKT